MSNKKRIISLVLPLAIIVVLLILGYWDAITTRDDHARSHAGSITWDGLERTYRIYIPSSYDKTKPAPLLIVLHGGGGTAEDMIKLTFGGFNTLSDKKGFIVVYPEGLRHRDIIRTRWNDGRDPEFSQVDDVGFISALIEHIAQTLNIDHSRVYATGISNGGLMSIRLARELSDKIAAIAVVAVTMPEKISLMSAPTKPISVLIMVGTKDPFVPWEGGETPDPTGQRKLGKVLSVSETVKYWVAHNNCSSPPIITWESDRDPKDGTRVRKEVYSGGKEGTEVILYTIEDGGHTWPGGWQYWPERFIGKTSRDIDANEVIWNFFKKHVR